MSTHEKTNLELTHAVRYLADRLEKLEAQDTTEVTSTIELTSSEPVPEVTISHDQLANGRWRYKTSLSMPLNLDDPRLVAEALELADRLGREEAARRTLEDSPGPGGTPFT